jgi:predicted amidophosphoribosyltransferase
MTDKEKLDLCCGCRSDFYNDKNPYGIKRCWFFGRAEKVTRTKVGYWQNPPYKWNPQSTLSCHEPIGMVWIKKHDPRIAEDA